MIKMNGNIGVGILFLSIIFFLVCLNSGCAQWKEEQRQKHEEIRECEADPNCEVYQPYEFPNLWDEFMEERKWRRR